jgi:hypothetical protein
MNLRRVGKTARIEQALRNTVGEMFPLSLKTAIPKEAYIPLTVFSAVIFDPFVTTNKDYRATTQRYVILSLVRITQLTFNEKSRNSSSKKASTTASCNLFSTYNKFNNM